MTLDLNSSMEFIDLGRRPSAARDGWIDSTNLLVLSFPSAAHAHAPYGLPVRGQDAGCATAPAVTETRPWLPQAVRNSCWLLCPLASYTLQLPRPPVPEQVPQLVSWGHRSRYHLLRYGCL